MSCPQIDFARANKKKRKAKGLRVGESLAPVQLGTEGPLIRGALSQPCCCRAGLLLFAVETGGEGGPRNAGSLGKATPAAPRGASASGWHQPDGAPVPQPDPAEGSNCSPSALPPPVAPRLTAAFSLQNKIRVGVWKAIERFAVAGTPLGWEGSLTKGLVWRAGLGAGW